MLQPDYFNIERLFYGAYSILRDWGIVDRVDGRIVFTGYTHVYYLKIFLIFISVFCTFLIIDFLHRLFTVRREESTQMLQAMLNNMPSEEKKNQRWEDVLRLTESDRESDWKLAVIEADKMLDDLLSMLGYQGETMGDKLLSVERGDMLSLEAAWEAHKFRNRIAHESGFQVSQRDARHIMNLYRKVFEEYQFI